MTYTIEIVVDISGLMRLQGNLETKPRGILESIGDEAVITAQGLVAVDTGALRDSIHKETISDLEVDVMPSGVANYRNGRPVELYSLPQEFGTYKMAAHPFFTPMAEKMAAKFLSPSTWMPIFAI